MNAMEKTLEYHELLMAYDDTSIYLSYELPTGFKFVFYQDGDEEEWARIHVESGEFMSIEHGLKHFHDFYDHFIDELPKRLFFVVDSMGEKVGTATISKLKEKEYEYEAVVDWFAIKRKAQGLKLSKPMISRFMKLANELGHKKLLLHTQTHTWLAAKLYLDYGFEPFNINEDIKGWEILKTITNHKKLERINSINEEDMYFHTAVVIKDKLSELYGDDFEYSIWHKNGRSDVEVNKDNKLYKFKYKELSNGDVELILENGS